MASDYVTIVAGDFNFDKTETNELTKLLNAKGLHQLVAQSTHDKGRAIDPCYVPKDLLYQFQLTYHSPYYTDHDALCINYQQ